MTITLDGTTGITTPGLTNTGTETLVNLTSTGNTTLGDATTDTLTVGVTGIVKDASGNVGIGTSSVISKLQVVADQASYVNDLAQLTITGTNTNQRLLIGYNTSTDKAFIQATKVGTAYQDLVLQSGGGNLLVGTTSGTEKFCVTTSANASTAFFLNNNGTANNQYGIVVKLNGDPNNTNHMLQCLGGANLRAEIRSNGGLANYSANNVNLSDERTKTDITTAGNYLAKICAIPVRTFKYKDQSDDLLSLGVIAQEVELIAPELVNVDGFGETPDDGIPLKAIYQTDLQYALMKCIQEQQALIQSLTTRITALETPVVTPTEPATPSTGTQA